jgi:hypothetical protein
MGNLGPAQVRYDVLPVPAVTGDAAAPSDEPASIAEPHARGVGDTGPRPAPENEPDPHD